MALAYGSFHELSHQLRFLLFEMGIALSQQHIDYYITLAHRTYLKKLQQAAIEEGFLSAPLMSHHVHDFLEQLRSKLKETLPESRFFSWDKLYYQCNETIANTALAQAYRKCWNTRLNKELAAHPTAWQWIEQQTTVNNYLFLDQWACLNQRINPSLEEIYPYTRREVLQYSAQFQAQFSIHWAAIRKSKTLASDSNQIMAKEFPQEYASWQQKISFHHVDTNQYQPIPIHPWLWRNQLQTACTSMIDNKSLILLPHHQKIKPSISPDIVMPLKNHVHLKLAAENNSPIEELLHSLLVHEQNYRDTLFLATKSFAMNIKTELKPESSLDFSLIQSPTALINNQQQTIPLLSLFASSPLAPRQLIDELIQSSGLNPITYFIHYCNKILLGPLNLLLKHGISFDAQAEQMSLIINNHLPQGLILRDLNQITMKNRICLEKKNETNTDFALNQNLRKEFISTMLQNNISHWIDHLHKEYQIETQYLWKQVRQILDYLFLKLEKDLPFTYLAGEKNSLFSEPWKNKALLTHLLKTTRTEPTFTSTPNPLSFSS